AQVKLLRLLQEKEYRHLGSQKTCRANVRIVASANTDLECALRERRFRSDLYYRLNVLPLCLPPLRQRPEDLPLLARHFATKYAREVGRPPRPISAEALACLARHPWPGNVRELENLIERAVLLTEGPDIRAEDLGFAPAPAPPPARVTLREQKARIVREFERDYLTTLLARHAGNISRAAVEAGKNRRALFELIRKHRLPVREFTPPAPSPR
ncbi:MAG: sigma 54-interacting transcriptional regulator, partial [Verrucomicrobiota bacterium]